MNDVVATLAPALFGVAGTVIGGVIAQRSAAGERFAREDAEARAALARLSLTTGRISGYYTENERGDPIYLCDEPPDSWKDEVSAAVVALLVANVHHDHLIPVEVAISLDADMNREARQSWAARLQYEIAELLRLLEQPRRRRRAPLDLSKGHPEQARMSDDETREAL